MSAELLVNVTPRETRVALIDSGVLREIFIERANRRGLVGNIYKGRVCRVLPGMQAAFVDIGLERAAFLHASDIADADAQQVRDAPVPGEGGTTPARREPVSMLRNGAAITDLVHDGQEVLVQVIKDPLGTKGARLTTHVSIPSCYVVYMPGAGTIGVSQRIEDEDERKRLREVVRDCARRADGDDSAPGEDWTLEDGYIVRTAAEGCSEAIVDADMAFLRKLWASVHAQAAAVNGPGIVHEDLTLVIRTLRELSASAIERVRIDSHETLRRVLDFTDRFLPEMSSRIELYTGEGPIFELYAVEDEIQKALHRKVQLKSGGHIVIDQTEAMTTVDVNTGRFVGHRNFEETIFKTNLEAAQTIARQLRLRNLGGIVIIDFIDMSNETHKRQVLRALEKALARDHTRTHISNVSPLGLVEMTRKRTRESLEHVLCDPCPTCSARGSIKSADTVCYEIFREILREARQFDTERLLVIASPEVTDQLVDEESSAFAELEAFIGKPITLQVESLYSREQYDVVLM
ncbi:MAG: ribonuclease G [Thiotrichales bacterium]|nr:ribonuclease G [Thiotrichales bacterium]